MTYAQAFWGWVVGMVFVADVVVSLATAIDRRPRRVS